MIRDWSNVRTERTCRYCGLGWRGERAHVIPRRHDPRSGVVDPRGIVTLCRTHHEAYDAGRIDLVPYLTHAEQAYAVERVGIVAALRYMSGRDRANELLDTSSNTKEVPT